jgi:hypothetical protein
MASFAITDCTTFAFSVQTDRLHAALVGYRNSQIDAWLTPVGSFLCSAPLYASPQLLMAHSPASPVPGENLSGLERRCVDTPLHLAVEGGRETSKPCQVTIGQFQLDPQLYCGCSGPIPWLQSQGPVYATLVFPGSKSRNRPAGRLTGEGRGLFRRTRQVR